MKKEVSKSVIKRLPRYYRFINELINQGAVRISSAELSKIMSLTASQIRQDLNCFGGFGQTGYGYNLPVLRDEIGRILGLDNKYPTIMVGAGNLGQAIAAHMNFSSYGVKLIGIFDSDPQKIGMDIGGIKVSDAAELEQYSEKNSPVAAILCIPRDSAQSVVDTLVRLGVKGFWNFSHYDLKIDHDGIIVENVHLGDSLMRLSYGLNNR